MHVASREFNKVQGREPVEFTCPRCGALKVQSLPTALVIKEKILYLFQVNTVNMVFLQCDRCQTRLSVKHKTLDDVYAMTAEQRSAQFSPYVSGWGKFLAIVSLLLFWIPFAAPLGALIAFFKLKDSSRWRVVAVIALILSLIVTGFIIWMLVVPHRTAPLR